MSSNLRDAARTALAATATVLTAMGCTAAADAAPPQAGGCKLIVQGKQFAMFAGMVAPPAPAAGPGSLVLHGEVGAPGQAVIGQWLTSGSARNAVVQCARGGRVYETLTLRDAVPTQFDHAQPGGRASTAPVRMSVSLTLRYASATDKTAK